MAGKVDILVLGATGFTGRLITRYLAKHPQRERFTFGIGARSQTKLDALATDLGLDASVPEYVVDVTKPESVDAAVKQARLVINSVGPYYRWGTPVVAACVANGVHYTGLAVETAWIRELMDSFDVDARAKGITIIPSAGFESVPSDLSVYLSSKALKEIDPTASIKTSTTGFNWRGGLSGGTLSSFMALYEDIPKEKYDASIKPWSISPIEGAPAPKPKWVYKLPHTKIVGGTFFPSQANRANVEATWGLLEQQAREDATAGAPTENRSYGPEFTYSEFFITWGHISAAMVSGVIGAAFGMARAMSPVRALLRRIIPAGSGPSEATMAKGYMYGTNVSESAPTKDGKTIFVKSVLKSHGDPGYTQTALMASESALGLLLNREELPRLGQRGGVLTPVSALGDVLVARLRETGTFEFEYGPIVKEGGKHD